MYDYGMISDGDHILVAVSGGKDSWALLSLLYNLFRAAPVRFQISALHISSEFTVQDLSPIQNFCAERSISFFHEFLPVEKLAAQYRRDGSSFCSFCARIRRGNIYRIAEGLGFSKIALGHNMEDLIETVLMNQFFNGQLKSMSPKYRTDDGKFVVIRPLIYAGEEQIFRFVTQKKFYIFANNCPHNQKGGGERSRVKRLIATLEKENPQIKYSILNSLKKIAPSHLLDKNIFDFQGVDSSISKAEIR